MGGADLSGLVRHEFQGFFPRGLYEGAVTANERMGEPFRMLGRMESEKPTGAEISVVASGAVRRIDFDQLLPLRLDGDLASVSAVAADGVGPFEHPGPVLVHREPAGDCADRADLDAAAAKLAIERV